MLEKFIKSYIRDQWVNYRKALNEPQAREEVLLTATLHFYEKDTTSYFNVFVNEDCDIPHPNPAIANYHGEFPDIFFAKGTKDLIRVELRDRFGIALLSAPASDY